MKIFYAVILVCFMAGGQEPVKHKPISKAWDVPAVSYVTSPSHPCNVSTSRADGTAALAVCITADETHWKCADGARVLLQSEDGVRHCILFPPQQPEVVSVNPAEPRK